MISELHMQAIPFLNRRKINNLPNCNLHIYENFNTRNFHFHFITEKMNKSIERKFMHEEVTEKYTNLA